jgi:hypothetical protein
MIGERRRPTEAEIMVQAIELLDREWRLAHTARVEGRAEGRRPIYQLVHSAVSTGDGGSQLLITELVHAQGVPVPAVLIEPIARQPEYLLLCGLTSDGPEGKGGPRQPTAVSVIVWRAEQDGPLHQFGRSLGSGDYFNNSRESLAGRTGLPRFMAWSSRRPELPDLSEETIDRLALEGLERGKTGPFGVYLIGHCQRFIEANAALLFAGYSAELPMFSRSMTEEACVSPVQEGKGPESFPWLLGTGADALLLITEIAGADVGTIPQADVVRALQLGADPSHLHGARDTGMKRIAVLFTRDSCGREIGLLPGVKHRSSWVLEDGGTWEPASTSFHEGLDEEAVAGQTSAEA